MTESRKRIAVLGLYNSGSTILAGMLHRMGINMGAPFWHTSEEGHSENFYESRQIAGLMRSWWSEPLAQQRVQSEERVQRLRAWAETQEAARSAPLGVKHPLLCLCVDDLAAAWGREVYYVRSWRSLDESIEGLKRRAWFPGFEVSLQTKLWEAIEEFSQSLPRLVTLDWNEIQSNPASVARELASAVAIDPTESQLADAATFVRGPALLSRAA